MSGNTNRFFQKWNRFNVSVCLHKYAGQLNASVRVIGKKIHSFPQQRFCLPSTFTTKRNYES